MRSASFLPASDPDAPSLRRRGIALGLTILAHLLLLLMLLRLAPPWEPAKPNRAIITFDVAPGERTEPARTKAAAKARAQAKAPAARATPTPAPARPVPTEAETARPLPMMILDKRTFAASDIGRMPQKAPGGDAGDADSAQSAGASDGGERGPGGEPLYKAEWFREPTDAELAFYLPKQGPGNGWGAIACRTVAAYRVEDCVTLGESPGGSGFGRAVLNAAWQFRVRPPRVGGKALVGSWVKIRIDYSQRVAKP